MTDASHFLDLFGYNDWANARVLEALEAAEGVHGETARFEKALDLLSHVLRAQMVWLGRIRQDDDAQQPFWHRDALPDCRHRSEQTTRDWLAFLEDKRAEDFERVYAYRNSKGQAFDSTLREIATHVINHGSHHRGQIALLLREMGEPPPLFDYIVFARSVAAQPAG